MQTVYNEIARPPQDIVAAFRAVLQEYSPSCLVADAHPRVGAIGGLYPVNHGHKIAGPALTVKLPDHDLVDILPVLSRAQPGDVVVLACHGNTHLAMWGGLMTALSQIAGIAGAIVDGAVRDVDEMRDLNFPAWYRGTMPRRCPATARETADPVQVNVPVGVGGEIIRPGDIVVADENGIAIVPVAVAREVLDGTGDLLAAEKVIRGRVNAGATVAQLLAEFRHL